MSFLSLSFALTLGLFLGLVLSMESGLRLGRRWLARNPGGLPSGMGAAEGAIFGLMSLLIAFSFSGAASRFEARKHLITSEANAIGTAYLRLDLLPPAVQPGLKQLRFALILVRSKNHGCNNDDNQPHGNGHLQQGEACLLGVG